MSRTQLSIILILLLTAAMGCTGTPRDNQPPQELRLSTTTSTCDTGLLDVLNSRFEQENNARVLTIPQGTGKAIATGELGAADVVLVHAPLLEEAAVDRGSFTNRTFVMYNYFVIIGPAADTADVRNATSAVDAFNRIAQSQAAFISRGDDSGTHNKELAIWDSANITPAGLWYQSVGKGMGDTIMTADIKDGYTLSDRGTYLAMQDNVDMVILFDNDTQFLYNPYHIMAVNPEKFPDVQYDLASRYITFITSPETQDIIRDFGIDEYQQPLFVPASGITGESTS